MSRLKRVSLLIVSVTVCLALVCVYLWFFNGETLGYSLRTEADGSVRISITIRQPAFFRLGSAEFFSCAYEMTDTICVDENGSRVEYTIRDGKIKLESIENHKIVNFSYEIFCPPLTSITAFSGEDALIIPTDWSDFSTITIEAESFDASSIILPFTRIKNPAWIDMHNLSKSCFALGNFREYEIGEGVTLYIEASLEAAGDSELFDVVKSVNLYYQGVFEKKPKYSIAITSRGDFSEAAEIVGGQSMIMPLDINDPDECRAFCHSLFYAFFDNFVDAKELRFSPNIWLNRGLATYYENLSLDALPQTIRDNNDLESVNELNKLYTRYLYFQIKEPFAYNATPGEEEIINGAAAQFYYFTKAPLIVAWIENHSGNNHSLIRNLIKNSGDNENSVTRLIYDTVGDIASEILDYLNNEKYITAPSNREEEQDAMEILRVITEYENILDSWYQLSSPEYPVERLYLLNPTKVLEMTDELGIIFSDAETESLVWGYSSTLYIMLRQNALRAYVCGAEFDDPALRFVLADNDNIQLWESFISENELEDMDDK